MVIVHRTRQALTWLPYRRRRLQRLVSTLHIYCETAKEAKPRFWCFVPATPSPARARCAQPDESIVVLLAGSRELGSSRKRVARNRMLARAALAAQAAGRRTWLVAR